MQAVRSQKLPDSQRQQALCDICSVLHARSHQLELNSKYWEIIGRDSIGAKAEELLRHTWAIEQAGFRLNPRVVLSMGFFESFRKRAQIEERLQSGAKPERIMNIIKKTDFCENATDSDSGRSEMEVITGIWKRFRNTPVAIRSSAHGDCRGTGIYESEFFVNDQSKSDDANLRSFVNVIRGVLASEFSPDAVAFRKTLSLPDSLAVIIEPVCGRSVKFFDGYHYGSNYGGVAYSSTPAYGALANICAGLPTDAVKGKGVPMPEKDGDLSDVEIWYKIGLDIFTHGLSGCYLDEYGCLRRQQVPDPALVDVTGLRSIILNHIKNLESLIGPFYCEFAVNGINGIFDITLLQIAKLNPISDFFELAEPENVFIRSKSAVLGTGQKICNGLILVENRENIQFASKYNETHSDYVLIYDGNLVSGENQGGKLTFQHVSNASVFIELPVFHVSDVLSHWKGALDTAKKLIFQVSRRQIDLDALEPFEVKSESHGREFRVFDVTLRVTSSERQQKAVVELIS